MAGRSGRETLAFADYSPHVAWGGAQLLDEEAPPSSAEERSARLAAVEVSVPSAAPRGAAFAVPGPPPPRVLPRHARPWDAPLAQLLKEAETVGESVWHALTPAPRAKPHAPIFTVLNFATCTCLLFWMLDTYAPLRADIPPMVLFVWGGRADARVVAHGEAWRYMSSMVLHSNLVHLVSNMVAFVIASCWLERRYGWWVVLPLYVVAGIGANLYSATWEGCEVFIGASGAVLGLVAALVADILFARRSMRLVQARAAFVLVAVVNLFVDVGGKRQEDQSVSQWSHIGGAVCGFAAAALALPLLPVAAQARAPPPPPPQTPRSRAAATMRRSGTATLLLACTAVLVFSFGVLPLNLAGLLRHRSFASQPKACAAQCVGWCSCSFSAAADAAGTPCLMARRAFSAPDAGATDMLRALRGGFAA